MAIADMKEMDRLAKAEPVLLEPDRPHGEWIDRSDGGRIRYAFWERYECSECGAKSEYTNYCPNCGASMGKLPANGEQVKGGYE